MSNKELYQQKLQAQLDEWKLELERLKAQAARTSAEAKLEMSQQVETLERQIEKGKVKLSELAKASDEAWEAVKEGVEASWVSLRTAFSEAAAKFKQ